MSTEPLDKKFLYGVFQTGEDKRSRLAHRAAHKALDILDDDMNINANRTGTSSA